jgi:hypothetical protein
LELSKYGLRARNAEHEKQVGLDVIAASDKEWNNSIDAEGLTV